MKKFLAEIAVLILCLTFICPPAYATSIDYSCTLNLEFTVEQKGYINKTKPENYIYNITIMDSSDKYAPLPQNFNNTDYDNIGILNYEAKEKKNTVYMNFEFKHPGVFEYELRQEIPENPNPLIIYDKEDFYKLRITVKNSEVGGLQIAGVAVYKNNEEEKKTTEDNIKFVNRNTYTPPSDPTPSPSPSPSPSPEPTATPTAEPTAEPTEAPTAEPTGEPTEAPTAEPTGEPTEVPTAEPTGEPTEVPTAEPTGEPTDAPTETPTAKPTPRPTEKPTSSSDDDDLVKTGVEDMWQKYLFAAAALLVIGIVCFKLLRRKGEDNR